MRTRVFVSVLLALAMLAPAAASPLPWARVNALAVTSDASVALVVEQAKQEVLVATDLLRSRPVADALRRGLLRGVRVLILTAQPGLRDQSGYLVGLAMAGAEIRVGYFTTRAIIVDGRYLITGPHLSGLHAEDSITLILDAPLAAAGARDRFLAAWQKGAKP